MVSIVNRSRQATPIVVYGAGGHAKVVIESLEGMLPEITIAVLDDDPTRKGEEFMGWPIIGDRSLISNDESGSAVAAAIGANAVRFAFVSWAISKHVNLIAVQAPSAVVSRSARVEVGAFIGPNATINACSWIAPGAIINTGASVDHDCRVGASSHVAPGARLCGSVKLGERVLVGAGATILPGIKIGADAIIGAGSVVLRDLPDHARVCGNPARAL